MDNSILLLYYCINVILVYKLLTSYLLTPTS